MNNENLSEKDSNQLSIDELLEKGKNKGTLTQNELVSMIDDNECDLDQIDKLYEGWSRMSAPRKSKTR